MLFNSLTFAVFLAVVLVLHALIPGWSAKKRLLLAASYLFYAAWNPPYVAILAFSTVVDWALARRIARSDDERARRALLAVSLAVNLTLLGFFKYGGFLLENFRRLAALAGVDYAPPDWDLVLPVGISFYTFASLSYTIDVWRREIRGDASLLDYALFVSFFPHLVAGPIVRARVLLPQFAAPRRASPDQLGWGLSLLAIGIFGKAVMADALFAPVVDAVYAAPATHGALDTLAAILGFAGQIYFDFAGYSLAAIGIALCFGFEFPDNFRQPYAARGFADFWRRWHISLSSWLRDYLYIPLGGNRVGRARTLVNLMLTMLIGGLWHGASWMFVLWGGLHGAFLACERLMGRAAPSILTFALVTLAWIPFRAPGLAAVLDVARGLVNFSTPASLGSMTLALCFAGTAAMLATHYALRDTRLETRFESWRPALQAAALGGCLVSTYLVSGGDARAFIYFQF